MWLDPLVERTVLKGINVTTNLMNVRLELLRNGKAVENKQVRQMIVNELLLVGEIL